ncbi:ABC transporter ATP-binding protein [Candidatus Woesearchaeota archaeon]|nr:ABC transporter ATP-binding protein [Candidatus Woesearchaeota archaeon]
MNTKRKQGAIIRLQSVWKIYNMGEVDVPALRDVSVDIEKGDFVAIIGASGSGKSTMMNLVGCLDIPTKGKIFLKSQDITSLAESDLAALRGKTIGFIFQLYNLLPNMTAYDNVILPLELQDMPEQAAAERAKKVLDMVGLSRFMHHRPTQLSGGQQQRVSIARSLAGNPEIILADEPTGALDSVTGREVIEMLYKLWKDEGKTVIMVTHDLNLARYANTHVELKDGKITRITKNQNQRKPNKGDIK